MARRLAGHQGDETVDIMKADTQVKRDTSIEEYKLVGTFESLKKKLLRDKYADRVEKPLAYWALPTDRGLPLAFMGRTVRDLLETSFDELSATPGVGQKKIAGLMMLLHRAAKDTPPEDPFGLEGAAETDQGAGREGHTFDPTVVSEALWAKWQETVKRHHLDQLKLGRVAPTLQALPTVIWNSPLEDYTDRSLAEIRNLKTHGEKRINAVMEVFWAVHATLGHSTNPTYLDVDLLPKFVRPVERWIAMTLAAGTLPGADEVRESLAAQILDQIKVDAGPTVWRLAADRLGMDGRAHSVRFQAKQMGVTRARVYQLLEECSKVMAVRWAEGEYLLVPIVERYVQECRDSPAARLLCATVDLFFPRGHEPVYVISGRLKAGGSSTEAVAAAVEATDHARSAQVS
jgi:hypothetical protein